MKLKYGMNLNGSEKKLNDQNGLPDNRCSISFRFAVILEYF